MASNPVAVPDTDRLKEILTTLTDAASFIEQILAAAGVGGASASEIERLTTVFSNLATVAIQAAHEVAGREITPGSVLELMPVSTPLVAPAERQAP